MFEWKRGNWSPPANFGEVLSGRCNINSSSTEVGGGSFSGQSEDLTVGLKSILGALTRRCVGSISLLLR